MKLIRLGKSFALVIPKQIVRALKIENSEFEVEIGDKSTIILKVKEQ